MISRHMLVVRGVAVDAADVELPEATTPTCAAGHVLPDTARFCPDCGKPGVVHAPREPRLRGALRSAGLLNDDGMSPWGYFLTPSATQRAVVGRCLYRDDDATARGSWHHQQRLLAEWGCHTFAALPDPDDAPLIARLGAAGLSTDKIRTFVLCWED